MSADLTENPKVMENSICESCGKDFSCGAEIGDCWCFQLKLSAEALAEINQKYDKCLCFDCLLSERRKSLDRSESLNS